MLAMRCRASANSVHSPLYYCGLACDTEPHVPSTIGFAKHIGWSQSADQTSQERDIEFQTRRMRDLAEHGCKSVHHPQYRLRIVRMPLCRELIGTPSHS